MVTYLGTFRGDLNLVRIPSGNYMSARTQMYMNINLLRLGIGGLVGLSYDRPRLEFALRDKSILVVDDTSPATPHKLNFCNYTIFPNQWQSH